MYQKCQINCTRIPAGYQAFIMAEKLIIRPGEGKLLRHLVFVKVSHKHASHFGQEFRVFLIIEKCYRNVYNLLHFLHLRFSSF